jgi:hypothetical protein
MTAILADYYVFMHKKMPPHSGLGITAITNVLGNKHSQSCGIRTKDKE